MSLLRYASPYEIQGSSYSSASDWEYFSRAAVNDILQRRAREPFTSVQQLHSVVCMCIYITVHIMVIYYQFVAFTNALAYIYLLKYTNLSLVYIYILNYILI